MCRRPFWWTNQVPKNKASKISPKLALMEQWGQVLQESCGTPSPPPSPFWPPTPGPVRPPQWRGSSEVEVLHHCSQPGSEHNVPVLSSITAATKELASAATSCPVWQFTLQWDHLWPHTHTLFLSCSLSIPHRLKPALQQQTKETQFITKS